MSNGFPAFTLLVVDDDPTILGILRLILQREGHRVLTADNGPSALQRCREEMVDLAVIDVVMPEMDGVQVADAFRRSPLTFSMPIVFCTGSPQLVPQRFADPLRPDVSVVSKPFQLATLRDAVAGLLAREGVLRYVFSRRRSCSSVG